MLSPSRKKAAAAVPPPQKVEPPLRELNEGIDHLERAIGAAREAYVASLRNPAATSNIGDNDNDDGGSGSKSTPGSFSRFFRRRSPAPQKEDGTPTTTATTSPTAVTPSSPSRTNNNNKSPPITPAGEQSPARRSHNNNHNNNSDPEATARFIDIPDADAFVETLRRVAELVVVGENFVTSLQKREDAAFQRSQEKWKARQLDILDLDLSESEDTNDKNNNTNQQQQQSNNRPEDAEHRDEYFQLYDLFFERNALEMIINLITGATFRLTDDERREIEDSYAVADAEKSEGEAVGGDAGEGEDPGLVTPVKKATRPTTTGSSRLNKETTMLPPFLIATQALQCFSILVQNVSRVTSLYVLLSNNLVNELINLPLDLYLAAARHQQLAESPHSPGGSQRRHQPTMTFSSPEISELTTHFVTFLKSLALRMNAQTLQFFLKYPAEQAADTTNNNNEVEAAGGGGGDTVTASSSHFSLEEENNPGGCRVDFPLYDRALEFCGAHQDSFVRITAMNICLNTLRLTTVSPPDELPEEEEVEDAVIHNFSLGSSPDGVLHNAKPLPFRERLAIAQYTCIPSRVERLISPIFTKLAERWNSLDEQIREIDSNKGRCGGGSSRSDKVAQAKEKARKEKLIRVFKDRAADLQDELLILEDVFKVGLTVLNEQTIEMMLATFVYPLLLQPLLLYCQRLSAALEMPVHSFSEHPLGGYNGDFTEAERNLAPVAGPAKTALFSLASVFYFLSNQPLLRLIGTALLHPLSPDSSGLPTLRSTLEVATVSGNGRNSIRLDRHTPSVSGGRATYQFGTLPGNRRVSKAKVDLSVVRDGGDACVFVLSPALAEVLEFRGEDESLIARTRPNQYRRALLHFLNAPADTSDVRGLAFHALDAAVTALDGKFIADVMYGADLKSFSDDMPADERNTDSVVAHSSDDRGMGGGAAHQSRKSLDRKKGGPIGSDLINEVISSLCRCVLTASKQPLRASEWRLDFDEVAAHALLCSVRCNERAMKGAATTTENLWWKAAAFVSAIPRKIPSSPMGGSAIPMRGSSSVNDPDYDSQIEGALTNFIFYDDMEESDNAPVAETFLKLREKQDDKEGYSVAISAQSEFDTLCCRVGRFLVEDAEDDSVPMSDYEEVQLARHDADALLKLDALLNLLKDMAATRGGLVRESSMAGIAVSSDGHVADTKESFITELQKQIYSPLSSATICALFDESVERELPATGTKIDLSGKPLLPCVCEAPASLSHLFASSSSGVVSEGVTWQSLYIVFSGPYLILAQPQLVKGSSEGRVITSCLLERLSVEQDVSADDSGPPARRLVLCHKWVDSQPPTFFMFDTLPEYEEYGPLVRAKPFTSTLDAWFEDQSTAEHAFQIVSSHIFAAKSNRGGRIAKFLVPELR